MACAPHALSKGLRVLNLCLCQCVSAATFRRASRVLAERDWKELTTKLLEVLKEVRGLLLSPITHRPNHSTWGVLAPSFSRASATFLTESSTLSLWQLTRSAFEAPGLEGLSGAAPPSESSDDDSDTTSSSMSQSGSGSGGSVVPMVLGDGPAHERVRGHHTFMRTLSL